MLYQNDLRLLAGVFVGVVEGQVILNGLVAAPAASGLPARSTTPVLTKDRVYLPGSASLRCCSNVNVLPSEDADVVIEPPNCGAEGSVMDTLVIVYCDSVRPERRKLNSNGRTPDTGSENVSVAIPLSLS